MLTNISTTTKSTFLIFLLIFLISIQLIPLLQNHSPKMSTPKITTTPINPYQFLHIVPNSDGTITRLPEFHPTVSNPSSLSLSKDVIISKNISVRVYLPSGKGKPEANEKLPILVFIHGGGFVLCSVGTPVVHEFCTNAASKLAALVVSVEYRLAPEHRLPAAYDDVLEALTWVKEGKDEWVNEYGNFSRCVIIGESAGGNIAYHAGLRAAVRVNEFKPLDILGLVLVQPYFGGIDRTGSEIRLVNDATLPLSANDLMWDLSLPVGMNRSHVYCDPFVGGGSSLLDRVRDLGWRVGVIGCDGDPLFDRNVEFVKLLENRGLNVKSMFDQGGFHGMFVSNSTKMKELFDFVTQFIT
ncbi:carboxylesterase 1-like [Silene latifolia]|uniref:carboxylesterase 1-like n=1 Tax=Silene latifolia TaxID=37657 RepID=UPI003D76D7EA